MKSQPWFLKANGQVVGPLSTQALKPFIQKLKANREAMVIRKGWEQWQSVADLACFLENQEKQAASHQSKPSNLRNLPSAGRDWYLYQNNKQSGPFTKEQIKHFVVDGQVNASCFFFQPGWTDWKSFKDAIAELGLKASMGEERRTGRRAGWFGKLVVHNDQVVTVAESGNISSNGIFIQVADQMFSIGEWVKLTVKIDEVSEPFNIQGRVVRFDNRNRFASGYGLRFAHVPEKLKQRLEMYVEQKLEQASRQENSNIGRVAGL